MTQPQAIYHRTMINLIHPAVLGTVIVNFISLLLSGKLLAGGAFRILSSCLLVWYFILAYWVIMTTFEEDSSMYGLKFFIIDIAELVTLFVGFYVLWVVKNDVLFLAIILCMIFWIGCWNLMILGRFDPRDPLFRLPILALIGCAVPLTTCLLFCYPLLHSIAKYVGLLAMAGILIQYTKHTLRT